MEIILSNMEIFVWLFAYLLTIALSGKVVRGCFDKAGVPDVNDERESVGGVIGKLENVLVLTIVMVEAYTKILPVSRLILSAMLYQPTSASISSVK
ncbi:hypothetical protein LL947_05325 [Halomonas sp. BLK-85]